jgi:integrase/recombinase XerC
MEADLLAMLLADKRSENTRRAYRYDWRDFFSKVYASEPTPELIRQFLALNTPQMVAVLLRYKGRLIAENLAEATVNRRLSSVLSLVKFARKVGATQADPGGFIAAEKVVSYRDTRGITPTQARLLLQQPNTTTVKGKRDYALLRLLLENALRRAEALSVTVGDFDPEARTLTISGKGRGTQRERITLSAAAVASLRVYLDARSEISADAPLFVSASPAAFGKPLTPDGLYKIVQALAKQAGLDNRLSPHRLRHTAITIALDASGGDVRRVQRLSRHARLETLQIYDDNRTDLQGEVTDLLSGILSEPDA